MCVSSVQVEFELDQAFFTIVFCCTPLGFFHCEVMSMRFVLLWCCVFAACLVNGETGVPHHVIDVHLEESSFVIYFNAFCLRGRCRRC